MTNPGPRPHGDYRSSQAYLRSNRPRLDASGQPTGAMIWPLPKMTKEERRG